MSKHLTHSLWNSRKGFVRLLFVLAALLLVAVILYGWLNPPSHRAYNPHDYNNASNEHSTIPPKENLETRITRETSPVEIEKWVAERSDLAAQWETADMANMAFKMGILGVILLGWTLFETRNAANSANSTLIEAAKARKATEIQVRPYLNTIYFYFSVEREIERQTGKASSLRSDSPHLDLRAKLKVKNFGDSPVLQLRVVGDAKAKILNTLGATPEARAMPISGHAKGSFGLIAPSEEVEVDLDIRLNLDDDSLKKFKSKQGVSPSALFTQIDFTISFDDYFTWSDKDLEPRSVSCLFRGTPRDYSYNISCYHKDLHTS